MARDLVRQLKRAVNTDHDTAAMYELLVRSVKFGHKRLALLRCLQAERMGIAIDSEILGYCQRVADATPMNTLREIMRRAVNG